MINLLIIWLVLFAVVLAVALIIDLSPPNLDRLVHWPFKDMIATNAVIFIGIFFTVLIGLIMLFGTTGLGWI